MLGRFRGIIRDIKRCRIGVLLLVLCQLAACGNSGNDRAGNDSPDDDITENQPPQALDLTLTTDEDSLLSIRLQGEDSDGVIAAYAVTTPPAHGSLDGLAPDLTYTPDADYYGNDSFMYQVTDNAGATSTATVMVTINAVNDAPTAANDNVTAQGNIITTFDAPGVLANDTDIDSAGLSITVETIASTSSGGSVSIAADGSFTYTPPATAGFSVDSFSYTLNDNDATDPQSSTGTVTIALITYPEGLSVQDLPAIGGATVEARWYLSGSAALNLSYQWAVSGGWAINSGQGSDVVTLTAPFSIGVASVGVVVTDESGNRVSASVALSIVGDTAPILDSLYAGLLPLSTPIELAVDARDPNGLAVTYAWSSAGAPVANGATSSWQPPLPGRYQVDIEVGNGSQVASGSLLQNYIGAAPWPFFRGSRQGTGSRIPVDSSSNNGQIKWQSPFTTADCGFSDNFASGVVQAQDGTLYVGSGSDGELYALDPDSGAVQWSFPTAGTRIDGTPVVAADGTIYIAEGNNGTIYAVNSDGSEKWSYAAGAGVTGSLAIGADGSVYVGTDNGAASVVHALNPDGTTKWAAPFDLDAETRSSVNFGADGSVVARDYAGNLFAIDAADGSELWQATFGGGSGSTPVIAADGTFYFGSFSPARLYAVNPDGSPKWDTDMGDLALVGIGATPAIGADGTLYIGVWEAASMGSIYAINPADGTVKWRHSLDGIVQSAATAVGADGRVYVASQLGILYALDPDSGAEQWTFDLQAAPNEDSPSPLSIGIDGSIYVSTCDGVLHALH